MKKIPSRDLVFDMEEVINTSGYFLTRDNFATSSCSHMTGQSCEKLSPKVDLMYELHKRNFLLWMELKLAR